MKSVVAADFETTTQLDDCRVWAWAIAEVGGDKTAYGKNIKSFLRFLSSNGIETAYFHNLAFDGKFITDFLLRHGYFWCKKDPSPGGFSTLVSSKGKFYQIKLCLMNGQKITFLDSLKLFPMGVAKIATRFGMEISKGELDYNEYRPVGHELTAEELDYALRDVEIVARALEVNFSMGLTKMTIGSNAMHDFKDRFGKKRFLKMFPPLSLELDAELRECYRGGFCYCEPKHRGEVINGMVSVDYNSMYPSVMIKYPYPVGMPIEFSGKYEDDPQHPLYMQRLTCTFSLKHSGVPMLQLRGRGFYGEHEYVRETVEPVQISVTSVDLGIMMQQYDIDVLSYDGGYKFFAESGLFDDYINYWGEVKKSSTGGERVQAKMMLNNLYGKFATNPDVTSKEPVMIDDVVHWEMCDQELKDPVYIPVAMFCTAYARKELFDAINCNRERYIYSDTDSIHLTGFDDPVGIRLDDNDLCAWKVEGHYEKSKHLRAKAYVLSENGALIVKCAGMPDNIKEAVTLDNFEYGFTNAQLIDGKTVIMPGFGKLSPKAVRGGVVLVDRIYRLQP